MSKRRKRPQLPPQKSSTSARVADKSRGSSKRGATAQNGPPAEVGPEPENLRLWCVLGAGLAVAVVWAYWPTVQFMVANWIREPDYSHGFLVLPIALYFAWARRDKIPWQAMRPSWIGLVILALALAGRYVAGIYYIETVDGWTLPVWIAGVVCLLFGTRVLWWAAPSIAFLWFMVPLPFSSEKWLSLPLQNIATKFSTAVLRMLNQPAIAEGHTIWIDGQLLEVERACSGLRIVFGIAALAFAFVLFSRWAWWQKGLALLAAVPIAILANAVRVVGTAVLLANFSSETAQRLGHDLSGMVMIPLAAVMFWLLLEYLERLFPAVQELRPEFSTRRPAGGESA